MKYIAYIFALIFLSTSCSTSDNVPPENTLQEQRESEIVDLSAGGLPLALRVSAQSSVKIDSKWNSAFGRMELSGLHGLNVFVIEDTLSCASKKEEIEGGVFDISYIIETESLIFYKSTLPDGSTPYWHFYASFPLGDSHYVFENNPLVECTELQIEAMIGLVRNIVVLNREVQ